MTPSRILTLLLALGFVSIPGLQAQLVRGPEILLNSSRKGPQWQVDVATATDGRFVAVWVSGGIRETPSNVLARVFSASGSPSTPEIRVSTADAGLQSAPAVAASANGDFVVVWQSRKAPDGITQVWGQRFTAAGQPVGRRFALSTHPGRAQSEPDVARAPDGRFVAAWTEIDGRLDHDGEPTTDVRVRRFGRNGNPLGADVSVAQTDQFQYSPAVAMNSAGAFAVAYTYLLSSQAADDYETDVYAQIFEFDGKTRGFVYPSHNDWLWDEYDPAVFLDNNGSGALVWTSDHADPDEGCEYFWCQGMIGLRAQRFSALQSELEDSIGIHTFMADQQTEPSIARTPDGGFLVTWTSLGDHDGDGRGVFVRRFGADGTPRSPEIQLNTHTAGNQSFPAVALAPDGRGVVVWQSMRRDGDDFGVAARRVSTPPQ